MTVLRLLGVSLVIDTFTNETRHEYHLLTALRLCSEKFVKRDESLSISKVAHIQSLSPTKKRHQ